jgi:ribosomal-protein-alanine N-acetyltransferase
MHAELYKWRSDEFTKSHNPLAKVDFEKFSEIMSAISSDFETFYHKKSMNWVIIQDDSIIALLSCSSINQRMQTAEIGYQVNPKFRKHGVGSSAVNSLVKNIFERTEIRKLVALISDCNIPSCKIIEKIGFKQEGLLRKHFIIEGQEVDERYYGILRNEFKSL